MPDRRLSPSRLLSFAPAAACAFFLFWNLGKPALWQDEAETALLAESVLRSGAPEVRDAGGVITGQPSLAAFESNAKGLWIWNTWLPYYLGAAGIGLLGRDPLAARLPFALAAMAGFLLARSLYKGFAGKDAQAQALSAWYLALNVPWLLFMRQCRYYSLAALGVLAAIWSYRELLSGRPRGRWALLASALWLFQSFFAYGAVALAALAADAWPRRKQEPAFFRRFAVAWVAAAALMLPQAIYFRVWARPGNHAYSLLEGAHFLRTFLLWTHQFAVCSPLIFAALLLRSRGPGRTRSRLLLLCAAYGLLVAALSGESAWACAASVAAFAALAAWAASRPTPKGEIDPARMGLLWSCCALAVFSLTGAEPYGRYLAPLLPLACFATGKLTAEVGRLSGVSSAAIAALLIGCNAANVLPVRVLSALAPAPLFSTVSGAMRARLRDVAPRSDLASFTRELLSGGEGYVEAISTEIRRRGTPDDTVFSDADNLSFRFHLNRRQLLPDELASRPPDWIVPSPWLRLKPGLEADLSAIMAKHRYELVPVRAPMTLWQNNPDILFHSFNPPVGERALYRRASS